MATTPDLMGVAKAQLNAALAKVLREERLHTDKQIHAVAANLNTRLRVLELRVAELLEQASQPQPFPALDALKEHIDTVNYKSLEKLGAGMQEAINKIGFALHGQIADAVAAAIEEQRRGNGAASH